jgi:hypothetical protein
MAEPYENIPKTIFVNFDDEVQPHILAGMLSRNISQIYNWAQIGKILNIKKSDPNYKPVTYKEVLKHLVDSLIKEDAQFAKYQRNRNRKSVDLNELEQDDSIHPLVAAKIQQQIKKEYAMESQIWQSIAIKNEEYVEFAKKLELVEPFIIQIRDLLLGIALDYPEVQETIDEGMENLYKFGVKLIEEAKIDRESFVEEMLSKTVVDLQDEEREADEA